MAQLKIEVSSELMKRLRHTAAKRGLELNQFIQLLLEVSPYVEREPEPGAGENGLRHLSPEELEAMSRLQGAKPVARFEDLLGNFWPEGEDIDDFIATIRRWRREGSECSPPTEE